MFTSRTLAAEYLSRARILASSLTLGAPFLDAIDLPLILRDIMTAHELSAVATAFRIPTDPAEALRDVGQCLVWAAEEIPSTDLYRGVWDAAHAEVVRLSGELAKRESGVHRSTVLRLVPRGESPT